MCGELPQYVKFECEMKEKMKKISGGESGLSNEAMRERIVNWLKNYLANLTEIDINEIDPHASFDRYGFDSYQGVVMTFELGEWLGVNLDPSDTFDHPSIIELSEFLIGSVEIETALSTRL
jgi:acyl carrier protein